jgi:hypothetical protein
MGQVIDMFKKIFKYLYQCGEAIANAEEKFYFYLIKNESEKKSSESKS